MSTDRWLSTGQFFHGTNAELTPEEMIEPGHAHNYAHLENSPHVFFTPHLDSARDYALVAAYPEAGHTYQVEPTGEHEPDPESVGSFVPPSLKGARRSKGPLRIVRRVPEAEKEA
jgi:hypothetical protein